jgi:hypothetical protein
MVICNRTHSEEEKYVMDTKAKILTATALGLAAALGMAGFVPISHPAIKRAVLKAAWKAGAGPCTIGGVKAVMWKGLTLDNLSCTVPLGSGVRCAVKAESVVLQCNLVRAFISSWNTRPPSKSVSFPKDPFAFVRHLNRASGGSFSGASMSCSELAVTGMNMSPVTLRGCSLRCSLSNDSCRGAFTADTLLHAAVQAVGRLKGDFSIRGNSFWLSRFTCGFSGGGLECSGRADFVRQTLGQLTLSLEGFDFDEWYRHADTSQGRLSGTADCRVALDSSVMALDSLHGRATVTASCFSISDFPFQQTLVSMLGYPALQRLRFTKSSGIFTLRPGGVVTTGASGHNDSLAIATHGRITTSGGLDQKVEITVSKKAVDALPKFARQTLEETGDGGRVLRLRIYGTFDNAKFAIDSKAILQKAVENMFNDVRDNLQKWLQQPSRVKGQ